MGNSGSVHHMQSSLKELHSYYQQGNAEGIDDLSFLNEEQKTQFREGYNYLEREKSLPRTKFSRIPSTRRSAGNSKVAADATAKNAQVKVLPNVTQHLRLRTTTNGAILHSGGTISGRKESLLPQPMVRSKTFIHESSNEAMGGGIQMRPMPTRRSQTQLSIDLKRNSLLNAASCTALQDNGAHYKRYSSNMSIKEASELLEAEQTASVSNSSETNQKFSKVKIKNKKRKAPPVPPVPTSGGSKLPQEGRTPHPQVPNISHKDLERKQRMFKTKSETVFQTSSRQQPVEQKLPVKQNLVAAEKARAPLRPKGSQRPLQAESASVFRREKSFDATVLSWRNQSAEHQAGRENYTGSTKRKPQQLSVAPVLPSKSNFKEERNDFKIELEAATKSRLMSKHLPLSEFRVSSKEASARQREPTADKASQFQPKTPPKTTKPETQSRIPQLKKTFYFGMEGAKRRQNESSQRTPNATAIPTRAKEVLPPVGKDDDDDMDSSSADAAVYTVGQKYSSEINDNGIQVNVRPMLPRRQLEIPRFSPIAAWRTLNEEHRKLSMEVAESPHSSNSALEAANTVLMEDRIYRTYREPCPFYPDNKSGDSGISGDDAYLPEKPIQPRNLIQNECEELLALGKHDGSPIDTGSQPLKVVGPFLTPWTPQQDLDDEEDTSSDGDLALKIVESRSPTSAHVFSLSLPRENQISLYGEKNKPEFRSLQKLKRTASGEFNTSACECTQSSDSNVCSNSCLGNYRSDNWLLSKTGTTPNTAAAKSAPSCNPTDSHDKSNKLMDWSAFIQPMSISCLATGKHLMYLPNRPMHELKRQSVVVPPMNRNPTSSLDDPNGKNGRSRNKRFSFQSSVRQIERRRLAEKLSKDADQKEALRKSELEVMRRVEEEFQRKRAYEKASIRHQLRLYSMDDDNFSSLPTDYAAHCNAYRAEPDGAVSSTSDSPVPLRAREDNEYRRPSNDLAMIFANS